MLEAPKENGAGSDFCSPNGLDAADDDPPKLKGEDVAGVTDGAPKGKDELVDAAACPNVALEVVEPPNEKAPGDFETLLGLTSRVGLSSMRISLSSFFGGVTGRPICDPKPCDTPAVDPKSGN